MKSIKINGGFELYGETDIQGSKNEVLPILAATVMCKGVTVLENCPDITDVTYMLEILKSLGCRINRNKDVIEINSKDVDASSIKKELSEKLRASILMLGSMLARFGEAECFLPGGCAIGARPIDMHIYALRCLGAGITITGNRLRAASHLPVGNVIDFPIKSVGATQNAILLATMAKGMTVIKGGSTEPEVIALIDYLNRAGANIRVRKGAIVIKGVSSLHDVTYRVESDRIVAGTYAFAVAGCRGNVILKNAPVRYMEETLNKAKELGCEVVEYSDILCIKMDKRPNAVKFTSTGVYPMFPTDMQPQLMSVLAVADGDSIIEENVFENRFALAGELVRLGANIVTDKRTAAIKGVPNLTGTEVYAGDLRAGAALVIAGLIAHGKTVVMNTSYIERGYVDICEDLKNLGARLAWKTLEQAEK